VIRTDQAEKRRNDRLKPFGPAGAAFLASLALAGAANAATVADRWQEAGSGAVALLPKPQSAKGIAGATLYCIEQRWSFLFRLDGGAAPAGDPPAAVLTLGDDKFPLAATARNGALDVEVPFDMLQPLREAARLVIGEGAGKLQANFSLKGSRDVIDAIAPRCSQVDMSAFESVALTPSDAAVPLAATLLSEEAKLFRAWAGTDPQVSAATVELADGKALLFASLCGSTSYYGLSGCTVAGFARADAAGPWTLAYNTEGALIHLDRAAASGGFPTIVSLPMVGSTTPSHWIWTGEGYELREEVMAEQDKMPPEEGDTSQ
jgi:hypothetical protein